MGGTFEWGYDCALTGASGLEGDVGLQVLMATAGSWFLRPPSSASEGCRRRLIFDARAFSDWELGERGDKLGQRAINSGMLVPCEEPNSMDDPLLSLIIKAGDKLRRTSG